EPQAPWMEQ
nr:Chain P, H-2 class I histocompatibility antigen, L-D alpha chain [Mus musculus]3V4U_P Chain P, H-2 class I histocompatibility antigen, L-D alpha chain [Mus musculus]